MAAPEGSNAGLLHVVDRILRLTLNDQVAGVLPSMDVDQLQHRAQEALQTLSFSDASGSAGANKPVVAAAPSLCSLAVECVNIVEKEELSVGLARLVAAGCEVLAGLLYPRLLASSRTDEWSYAWVEETLEDLSDQIDFLALEVYCGLGRLEGTVSESDALPVVLNPCLDDFGSYWGSIEHRQALQELSAWLLCVVFRALGYAAVTAHRLMEFANYDALCLCALLRGLLSSQGSGAGGMPCDAPELRAVALGALCGLTAPDLAFPYADSQGAALDHVDNIEEQNRTLRYYLEVVCAAVVDTGLLGAAMETALEAPTRHGAGFLSFLASLVLQADGIQTTAEDPYPPPLRLRAEVTQKADRLGVLLEAVLGSGTSSPAQLKELVASSATLAGALAAQAGDEGTDDGFTLACRLLLATCLERGCGDGPDAAVMLAALGALAANVGDLAISRVRLAELAAALRPEERLRARARLERGGRLRLPVCGGSAAVVELFADDSGVEPAEEPAPAPSAPPAPSPAPPAAAAKAGLRDLVQNAPPELRCALDGKLLCDPVLSPGGVLFERSTLLRWLQKHGPQCPITGTALRVEDCRRSPETRKQVTEWVRRQREPKSDRRRSRS